MENQLTELVRSISRARQQLLKDLQHLGESGGTYKPNAVTWSVTENLEHLYYAEFAGINYIWVALEVYKQGNEKVIQSENKGLSIEKIIEKTWKAKEVAPPSATPRLFGPLAFWKAVFESNQLVVEKLAIALTGIGLENVVYPHFLCGTLDARQRLEFIRFHIERHHQQILRILKDLDTVNR